MSWNERGEAGGSAAASSSALNLATTAQLYDDFISPATSAGLGWSTSVSGTGATVITDDSTNNHPGVLRMQTGTTTTGRAGFGGYIGNIISINDQDFTFETCVAIGAASDGTETFFVEVGLSDSWDVGAAANNLIGFRYLHSENSANWTGRAINATTGTTLNTSSALVANTYQRLRIVNASGTLTFSVDGTSVGTIATNLPTGLLAPSARIVKSAGTTTRFFRVDYMYLSLAVVR